MHETAAGTLLPARPREVVCRDAVCNPSTRADVMAFSGSAPEITNGRVAMLGFVCAAATELAQGKGVASQLADAQIPIALTVAVFVIASLIPLFNTKEGAETPAAGPFNAEAERLNGRAAMIGITALIILEAARSGAPLL
jgi:hypothetical protein